LTHEGQVAYCTCITRAKSGTRLWPSIYYNGPYL